MMCTSKLVERDYNGYSMSMYKYFNTTVCINTNTDVGVLFWMQDSNF